MQKQVKEILRKIQQHAAEQRTYYVILPCHWCGGDMERLVERMGYDSEKVWADLYALEERYNRFCHYMKEVKPQWKAVRRIHFADNSTEEVQVNKYGEERQVMVEAPHGDACF